ncbi:aminoglycoside phosphotransferase family protein [Actinospica durhamensis]|uniref:Aminoglycoside phosphotransferase family protein n=1 Tax=Actinospica durhamensis TaxID=1508375 RepID=A0A941EN36_9ACTN|nr:aminoglycoside phosphotransferase family protein [Actinospica durhamensis]MBR7833512.1 aminoglycoside phosphotransferase family protein [Actinospica durhamensis]
MTGAYGQQDPDGPARERTVRLDAPPRNRASGCSTSAPLPRHQSPAGLTPADLEAVDRDTGRGWCVLGRLAGGMADSVQLLGSGDARAVVKIKNGQWWGGQLERTAVTADALRAAGYPTPPVLGCGPLGEDRFYLATGFAAGSQPAGLDPVMARAVLAAVDLHAAVHPPQIRDWSAMITLFLNGGIAEHRFPAPLAGLARQALDLVSHPVPALPSGDFVHGDFSTRNLLTDDRRLSAVIDIEGFGRGTRTIDLVSLLDSGAGPEDRGTTDLIVEAAIAASDEHTFRACLSHRVLASLISTPRAPSATRGGRATGTCAAGSGRLMPTDADCPATARPLPRTR